MCQLDLAVPFEGWKDLDPPMDEDSVCQMNLKNHKNKKELKNKLNLN